jgi:dTDP-4-amino-4,6-dideoxygalactose transaminase
MYKGKKIGTIGDFAAFSMHEVKNIPLLARAVLLQPTSPALATK